MTDVDERLIPLNTVYRIVVTDPPTLEDFMSHAERGIEPRRPLPVELARLHSGISVFCTMAQAKRTARKFPPWLGRGHIARIVIPDDAKIRIERTTKSAGHYTMRASARGVLSWVDSVEAVLPPRGHGDGV